MSVLWRSRDIKVFSPKTCCEKLGGLLREQREPSCDFAVKHGKIPEYVYRKSAVNIRRSPEEFAMRLKVISE